MLQRIQMASIGWLLSFHALKWHIFVLVTPFKPNEISRPIHFSFKGCWMVFFIFGQILIEHTVSKQWRPWSDATFCGVWSGFALFAYVPQKDARLKWIKDGWRKKNVTVNSEIFARILFSRISLKGIFTTLKFATRFTYISKRQIDLTFREDFIFTKLRICEGSRI